MLNRGSCSRKASCNLHDTVHATAVKPPPAVTLSNCPGSSTYMQCVLSSPKSSRPSTTRTGRHENGVKREVSNSSATNIISPASGLDATPKCGRAAETTGRLKPTLETDPHSFLHDDDCLPCLFLRRPPFSENRYHWGPHCDRTVKSVQLR